MIAPMLAANARCATVRYPVLASPKLDGVRALVVDGVLRSRSGKPIPNRHAQALFGRAQLNGLDGELIVGAAHGPGVFARTTAGVMSAGGAPDVTFHVFDDYTCHGAFAARLAAAHARIQHAAGCVAVPHTTLRTARSLAAYESRCVKDGYEGVMLRAPAATYKHGRSTAQDGGLLKLKRYADAEAIILGAVEMTPPGSAMLGALRVQDRHTGAQFHVGTGFSADDRAALWARRHSLTGRLAKYRHQPSGAARAPRFPSFIALRDARDTDPPRSPP